MKLPKKLKLSYLHSNISKLNTFLFLKPELKSIIINIDNLMQHTLQMEKTTFKGDSPDNEVTEYTCPGQ